MSRDLSRRPFYRSQSVDTGYKLQGSGRKNFLNGSYIGFVKDNRDVLGLGRLRIWIPELGGDPTDEAHWYTVQYCTPFGGTTNIDNEVAQNKGWQQSQMSYGMFAVPPHLDVQVVVMFIQGDPNRGIYIGQLFPNGATHSMPSNAANYSYQGGTDTVEMKPPVVEYNKKSGENPATPNSPRFDPLHQGLYNQGLYTDMERGVTDTSVRRDIVPQVFGLKSPQGHSIVIDDGKVEADPTGSPILEGNTQRRAEGAVESIRLRTKSGVQIYINDTTGYIYMNTKLGNSWFEISDDGIAMYTKKNFNIRTEGDVNWRVDGNFNLEVQGSFNWANTGDVVMKHSGNTDLNNSQGIRISSEQDFNVKTGTAQRFQAGDVFHVGAGPEINLKAGQIFENTKDSQPARTPSDLKATVRKDTGIGQPPAYTEGDANSIIPQKDFVTHEPWRGHPRGGIHYTNGSVVSNCVPVVQQPLGNGQSATVPAPLSTNSATATVPTTPFNNSFIYPISGAIGAEYGQPRADNSNVLSTDGVDIPATTGTPVVASSGGTIKIHNDPNTFGNYVTIEHENGFQTLYGNLSSILVPNGTTVKQGEQLGISGSNSKTGESSLHFQVSQNGQPVSPGKFLPSMNSRGLPFTSGSTAADSNPIVAPPITTADPTYNASDLVLSQTGLDQIKTNIPFADMPTKDASGNWVIGYGTQIAADQAQQYIDAGQGISKDYADVLLQQALSPVQEQIRTMPTQLTQSAFDSLVSAGFNIGGSEVVNGPVGQNLVAGNTNEAIQSLQCYTSVDGNYNSGLANQRMAEGQGIAGGGPANVPTGLQHSDDTTKYDPANMSLSNAGISNLTLYEGISTTVYNDTAGNPTIGIGHKLTPQELSTGMISINGQNVPYANGISLDNVYALKSQDAQIYQNAVRQSVTVPLTQNQFDSLTSLAFNTGATGFKNSTLVRVLNTGDYQGAANQFAAWNKSGGQVTQGLINRRAAEAKNFTRDF